MRVDRTDSGSCYGDDRESHPLSFMSSILRIVVIRWSAMG